ncbi:acyltransferase [Streptomyces sp. V1I1]|uniref:acyltransferase family protein n=1 Tax=Streptomyces sp. V1I1 TaxID=3042272 RepID=UPI00277DD827|nr:acyltransferase [Streptomyces sp. V1I1]MDQ0940767.1 peptidoglycan/LPS O-acetylase OafA/YrhL [Streptomyces sp. V1I1]
MPDEPAPRHLPSLTSLRFVFACAVVWFHMSFVSGIFDGPLQMGLGATEPFAAGAVSGFFVLSGFVLTWVHRPGGRARAFWRRRWWKIFPNHLLAWTAAVVFFAVTTAAVPMEAPPGQTPWAAVAGLFLVQDWVPDYDVFTGFNTPAWSISCEAFFYALFPALIVVARKIPVQRLRWVWTGLAVVIVLMPLVATAVPGRMLFDWLPINERSMWFIYVFPPVRLLEFILGMVTARLIQTGTWPRVSRLQVSLAFVAFFLLLPFVPRQYAMSSAMAPALAAVIAKTALADLEGRTRRLPRPALIALGEASYALYITHFPLMMAARHLIGPDPGLAAWEGFAFVFALIALSIGLSLVVYRYFERPLMRRFAGSHRTPPQPSSAPSPAPAFSAP